MYERLETAPGTIGIRLGQTLTVEEIDLLYADVAVVLEGRERINYFVDASAYAHIGLEAGLYSLKKRLAHLDWFHRFERVAVVTDSAMMKGAVQLFDLFTPMMDVRAYEPGDSALALGWCEGG